MHATTLAPFKGRFTDGPEGLQRALSGLPRCASGRHAGSGPGDKVFSQPEGHPKHGYRRHGFYHPPVP